MMPLELLSALTTTPLAAAAHHAARVPIQMIALGAVILGAYLGGRITQKLRLSDVTGQLLGGAAVGPAALHGLGILGPAQTAYDDALHTFQYFVFVYLCLIAFGIGEELHASRLRKVGKSAIVITVVHGTLVFGLVFVALSFIGGLPTMDALVVASIGVTSAPAIAFVLMNQLRVEGRLRSMVGGVLVLTDLLGVLLFSFLTQLALRQTWPERYVGGGESVWMPVLREFSEATGLGVAVFLLLRILIRREAAGYRERSHGVPHRAPFLRRLLAAHPSPSAELLLIAMGAVSLGTGIAYALHLPFLVTAVVAGFLVANFHSFAIFDALKIDAVASVFNLTFFALVGATMSVSFSEPQILWLAALYVVARWTGKLVGGWLGARLMREDSKIRAALPAQLVPQTGVAAVEAVFLSHALMKPHLAGIILPSIVVFGVAGVVQVERALRRYRRMEEAEDANRSPEPAASGLTEAARRILGALPPEGIVLSLHGSQKMAVIAELVDHAIAISPQHIDREQALQVIREREQLAPTGMGNGVAMPHCRLISLEQPMIVLGRDPDGVVFGGMDEDPCNIILMILSNGRNPAEHLQIMAAAAHLLSDDVVRNTILEADDEDSIMRVIIELAEQRGHNELGDPVAALA